MTGILQLKKDNKYICIASDRLIYVYNLKRKKLLQQIAYYIFVVCCLATKFCHNVLSSLIYPVPWLRHDASKPIEKIMTSGRKALCAIYCELGCTLANGCNPTTSFAPSSNDIHRAMTNYQQDAKAP